MYLLTHFKIHLPPFLLFVFCFSIYRCSLALPEGKLSWKGSPYPCSTCLVSSAYFLNRFFHSETSNKSFSSYFMFDYLRLSWASMILSLWSYFPVLPKGHFYWGQWLFSVFLTCVWLSFFYYLFILVSPTCLVPQCSNFIADALCVCMCMPVCVGCKCGT